MIPKTSNDGSMMREKVKYHDQFPLKLAMGVHSGITRTKPISPALVKWCHHQFIHNIGELVVMHIKEVSLCWSMLLLFLSSSSSSSLSSLEGAARYAGLLLTPAEGFGLRPRLFFGQKNVFLCLFWPPFWSFMVISSNLSNFE